MASRSRTSLTVEVSSDPCEQRRRNGDLAVDVVGLDEPIPRSQSGEFTGAELAEVVSDSRVVERPSTPRLSLR